MVRAEASYWKSAGLVLLAIVGCADSRTPTAVSFTGPTMGTTYSVTIENVQLSPEQTRQLQRDIDEALATLNRQMSTYDPESEISRFNDYEGTEPFPVSEETVFVVKQALEINEHSGGAFDVTVGPLVNLWGFGPAGRKAVSPDAEEINALRQNIGSEHLAVQTDPPALIKKIPQLQVDLSAIAKGYGVDLISSLLRQRGMDTHMVEIGGEVVGRGRAWRIGIEKPSEDITLRSIQEIVRLQDQGMATSGNYRNFFDAQGNRYSHTINPRTGRPVEHHLASATILAPTCAQADAIATAVMVMGPDEGFKWLESQPGVEGLLLTAKPDGTFVEAMTAGMKQFLQPE